VVVADAALVAAEFFILAPLDGITAFEAGFGSRGHNETKVKNYAQTAID